jgi:hypothetical protein
MPKNSKNLVECRLEKQISPNFFVCPKNDKIIPLKKKPLLVSITKFATVFLKKKEFLFVTKVAIMHRRI